VRREGLKMDASEEERFMRLEVKAAYLEKLALDLDEVVVSQSQQIDDLQNRLERIERQLRSGDDDERIPDEKPPHY
jgi:uncharacterized coiled-coil protein SlyX